MNTLIRSMYRRSFIIAAFITLVSLSLTSFVPAEAAAPRKVIVFLQGMCTSTDASSSVTSSFNYLMSIIRFVYPQYTADDFMLYSYRGGNMRQRFDTSWYWWHNAYGETIPLNQSIQTSVDILHNQLMQYRLKVPNATFILVGHSFGGVIAWNELLQKVSSSSYPQTAIPLISKIITIDSPLQGVPTVYNAISTYLGWTGYPCRNGPNVTAMVNTFLNAGSNTARYNAAVQTASQKGVKLVTVGNTQDGMWVPTACNLPLGYFNNAWVQFVLHPTATTKSFSYNRYSGNMNQCMQSSHHAILNMLESAWWLSFEIGPK